MVVLRLIRLVLIGFLFLTLIVPAQAYRPNLAGFGGDGTDGSLVISGTVIDSVQRLTNASLITLSPGATWNVKSGTRLNATNLVQIAGTLNVGPGIIGPDGTDFFGTDGAGPGCGRKGQSYAHASTGAGFGGRGGLGGAAASGAIYIRAGGSTYGPEVSSAGSSGASGNIVASAAYVPGSGGDGGGSFSILSTRAITVPGSIHVNGGAGGNALVGVASGGGGGSGGYCLLASLESVTVSGTITSTGGRGGNGLGSYGGAAALGASGAGGGVLVFIAPLVTLSGTVDVDGGAPGTPLGAVGLTNQPGEVGRVVVILQKPNLPLISLLRRPGVIDRMVSDLARGNGIHTLSGKQLTAYLSNLYGSECKAIGGN